MMEKDAKIYVAGHRGMVGSAIVRELQRQGYTNIITRTHKELDLCRQNAVEDFFEKEKPEYVFLAAAKVGGIVANQNALADFMYDNMILEMNVINSAWKLHIDKALDVVDLKKSKTPKQPVRLMRYHRGQALELLGRCKYFQVERMLLNTEICRELAELSVDSSSFQVLLCIGGCGLILYGVNGSLQFFKGDCIFVPANSVSVKIHGNAQLLRIRC